MEKSDGPIIESLLDQDLYKLTMLQVYYNRFGFLPGTEFRFRCRTGGAKLGSLAPMVKAELENLCLLRFSDEDLAYLATLPYLRKPFLSFLKTFQFDSSHIQVATDGDDLDLRFQGDLISISMFEIFALAIVNEVYTRSQYPAADYGEGRRRLQEKIQFLKEHPTSQNFAFADFGTRRRFSRSWQEEIIDTLASELPGHFVGTSNVFYARQYGLKPIGTMAHEFFQVCQALSPELAEHQKLALETWFLEYGRELGIALTDIVGFEAFLRDFSPAFAESFDGLRHDSGDPLAWGERALDHYKNLGVDPSEKTLVFSDGLNFPRALEIYDRFQGRARLAFGIGTNLTNDLGYESLNIVVKMTHCLGRPVAKISDSPGKEMCDDLEYLQHLADTFGLERNFGALKQVV